MKTLRTLIAVVLVAVVGMSASAQVARQDAKTINLTANLNTTIALTLDESDIVFDFNTLADYKNGLGSYDGKYASTGSVSSTNNWNLFFRATKDFKHSNNTDVMPLNNVGLTAKWRGTNAIVNKADKQTLALSKKETMILGHSNDGMNAGDHDTNGFTIYWEMGTKGNGMNGKSIFEQDLKKGTYNTQVEFTAREIL
eukprot:TRINITY_DN1221_c0_g2_i1.p1 TRINITY_DN1221_c0_g2~~TRINITY_DN1221_c0_g2_i1.p1  ORF type:complete len:197 (+),score=2.92 TRINITY_DN1221_c0_g2_i1:40-630(+)